MRCTRVEPAHRHPLGRNSSRCLPDRLAVDRRGHSELRKTRRGARDLARISLSMADKDLLVWVAVDLDLHCLYCRDAWHWNPDRMAADRTGGTVVHLPRCSRLVGVAQRQAHVRLEIIRRLRATGRGFRDLSGELDSIRCETGGLLFHPVRRPVQLFLNQHFLVKACGNET